MAPGSSVMPVCRMHGISSGQFRTWRRQFRTGELTGFVPVMVASAVELPAATAPTESAPIVPAADGSAGVNEVELPSGTKLRLTGADAGTVVDAAGGDRLARAASDLGAGSGGLTGAA